MLAKLIVHARSRGAAIDRMRRALSDLRIGGLATTIPFHRAVMEEPDFIRGDYSILYIDEHPDLISHQAPPEWRDALPTAAVLLEEGTRHGHAGRGDGHSSPPSSHSRSPWQRALDAPRSTVEAWRGF